METKNQFNKTLQWLQFFVLCLGVAALFVDIGRKTELLARTSSDIQELREITKDLTKAQIITISNDVKHIVMLDDIKNRILILERRD